MSLFVLNDTGAAGAGTVFPQSAEADLLQICKLDMNFGEGTLTGDLIPITYGVQTATGPCPTRIHLLVNTNFPLVPADPVDIIILALDNGFTSDQGSMFGNFGGLTLNPAQSFPGFITNPTNSVLVLYDTSQGGGTGYCLKGQVSGAYDLQTPNPVILYHELSHALRSAQNTALSLSAVGCAASPEENAAEIDENDMRTQLGIPLRDTTDHCGQPCSGGAGPGTGSCCIVATIATGSPYSAEVNALRQVRDSFLRSSEIGYAFFDRLFYDYYGFSPEVCRTMAGSEKLRGMIETCFVKPLANCLTLIQNYTLGECTAHELGVRFEQGLANAPDVAALTDVEVVSVLDLIRGTKDGCVFDAELTTLSGLLYERTRTSEYVQWALVETTAMYLKALLWRSSGVSPAQTGTLLAEAFDEWAGRMPLVDVWKTLSRYAIAEELAFLKKALLRSPQARQRFGARLGVLFRADEKVLALLTETGFLPHGWKS